MGLTYVQLKQGIQDWAENDAAEFTTATGSGKAPIDLCIELAEDRIQRESDLNYFRKTTTILVTANTNTTDVPQDVHITRYMKLQTGDFLEEKDDTFIREYTQNSATFAPDVILYGSLVEASIFMKDTAEKLQRYQGLYDRSLQTFIAQEQIRKRTDEFIKGEIKG